MKWIFKFFKWLTSKARPHPIVNQKLDTAIDDKIKKRRIEQEKLIAEHNAILTSYAKTFFSKQYANNQEMAFAFVVADKQWRKHVREVNSTNKLINLGKEDFKKLVMKTFADIQQSKNQKPKTDE